MIILTKTEQSYLDLETWLYQNEGEPGEWNTSNEYKHKELELDRIWHGFSEKEKVRVLQYRRESEGF